jgi:ABC-type polysaccharide/polyol phosphate transport system ATPase subunit
MTMLCEQVIWLERGRVVTIGPTQQVLDQYTARQANAAPLTR